MQRDIFYIGVLASNSSAIHRTYFRAWLDLWKQINTFSQLRDYSDLRVGQQLDGAFEVANAIFCDDRALREIALVMNHEGEQSAGKARSSRRRVRSSSCTSAPKVSEWYDCLIRHLSGNSLDDEFRGIRSCPSNWVHLSDLPSAPYCIHCACYYDPNHGGNQCGRCRRKPEYRIDYVALTALHVHSLIIYHFYRKHFERYGHSSGSDSEVVAAAASLIEIHNSPLRQHGTATASGSERSGTACGSRTGEGVAGLSYSFVLSDATFQLSDLIRLIPLLRPYRNLSDLKREAFEQQCYYITHLIISYTDWGRQPQLLRTLYRLDLQPELEYLLRSLPVVMIEMKDVELTAEIVTCFCILRDIMTEEEWQRLYLPAVLVGLDWIFKRENENTQRRPLATWPCFSRYAPNDLAAQFHVVYTVLMAATFTREVVLLRPS